LNEECLTEGEIFLGFVDADLLLAVGKRGAFSGLERLEAGVRFDQFQ
jgi:hypothetical protein